MIDRCTCGDWRFEGKCNTCLIRAARDAQRLAYNLTVMAAINQQKEVA